MCNFTFPDICVMLCFHAVFDKHFAKYVGAPPPPGSTTDIS